MAGVVGQEGDAACPPRAARRRPRARAGRRGRRPTGSRRGRAGCGRSAQGRGGAARGYYHRAPCRTPPRTLAVLLACLLLAAAGGCGDDERAAGAAATPTPEDTGGEQTGRLRARRPSRSAKSASLDKPTRAAEGGPDLRGDGGHQLRRRSRSRWPPGARRATGGSFKYLADQGFYDGTTFHRIVPGFVIQGGDPQGDGTGGPGYSVVEPPPQDLVYARGVVAMAKTELEKPGTSGSQFFIVTGEAPHAAAGLRAGRRGDRRGGRRRPDRRRPGRTAATGRSSRS